MAGKIKEDADWIGGNAPRGADRNRLREDGIEA